MFARWSNILKPPHVGGEPHRQDQASLLWANLCVALGLAMLLGAVVLFWRDDGWERLTLIIPFMIAVTLALLWLLRQGRVELVAHALVVGYALVVMFGAWIGVGVQGSGYSGLILVTLMTALLIGRRAAYVAAGAFSVLGLVLVWGRATGRMPLATEPLSDIAVWINLSAYFFLSAFMVNYALGQAARAIEQARQELAERRRAEEEVRRLNADLEQRVAERTAQLAESEARYRLIAENAQDVIWTLDMNLRVTYVSPSVERVRGYTPEEVKQQTLTEMMTPESLRQAQQTWLEEMAAEQSGKADPQRSRVLQLEYRRKDGETTWSEVHISFIRDASGRPTGLLGVGRDVTRRRQAEAEVRRLNADLEQRVQERTAQLAAANDELASASYTISHDLRAPLRAISGYAHLILDEHAEAMEEEGRRKLEAIRANALRMGRLVDGLLAFLRLNQRTLTRRHIHLGPLARRTLDSILAEQPGREVRAQVADPPECLADAVMLQEALARLLDNALKFTRPRPVAEIEFGHLERNGEPIYFVRDNGVGFNMDHAPNLFGLFDRLHHTHEFEGLGLGLALAARIIQRHGGRIWAEAVQDHGATFYFTLSDADAEDSQLA